MQALDSYDVASDQQTTTLATIGPSILLALERFVEAWQSLQSPPILDHFLPNQPFQKWLTLVELIKVDLEYRYQIFNFPKSLDDYIDEYAELEQRPLPSDLIYEEFYFRQQSGLSVDPASYIKKYPDQARTLRPMLDLLPDDHSTYLISRGYFLNNPNLQPGYIIDDFELIMELGQGSFARVFKARQRSLNRIVAVKISEDIGYEPQTLAQMDHPFIIRVFDQRTASTDGLRLLYMEYAPGGTLQNLVANVADMALKNPDNLTLQRCLTDTLNDRQEPIPTFSTQVRPWSDVVCSMGIKLAMALDYAHRRGILHLDIKPANILLTTDGSPKLADFNTSLRTEFISTTSSEYLGGSMAYMSPEQLAACHPEFEQSAKSLDGRSDIYSLGISLWQLLFGQRPYPNQSTENGLLQAMTGMIETRAEEVAITAVHRDKAPGLVNILKRCITPKPEDRIPSGSALAKQLSICHEPRAYLLVYPEPGSIIDRLRRFAIPILVLLALFPNMLAGIFNYYYNSTAIIAALPQPTQDTFWHIQLVINLVAFPIGLSWFLYLARPILRSIKPNSRTDDVRDPVQHRNRCLQLGHYGALINICLWSLAGIAYPLALHFSAGPLSTPDYPHFFGSLLLCGLLASVFPFFLITAFSVRAIYPKFLPSVSNIDQERNLITVVQKRTYTYFCLAALLPLLTILALVLIESEARVALLILSAASLIGIGFIFVLFRFIQSDFNTLQNTLDSFESIATPKI